MQADARQQGARMARALTTAKAARGGKRSAREIFRKLKPGPGQPPDHVASHQRNRIHGAMMALASEHGYDGVTVQQLVSVAGVSTRSFYKHFANKEECMLDTYDSVVTCAGRRVLASQRVEDDWRSQLRAALSAFAEEVAENPQAARLAMIEAFTAGPEALEHMRRTQAIFEAVLRDTFGQASDGVAVPPLLLKAMVAGVAWVSCVRLIEGCERELPGLVDDLHKWATSLHSEVAEEVHPDEFPAPENSLRRSTGIEGFDARGTFGDERALLLSAAARLAATDGYQCLTVPRIREAAGVSRKAFDARFQGVDDCFLAAVEDRICGVLAKVADSYRAAQDWPEAIRQAVGTLCEQIGGDPVFARAGFVEVFAPAAMQWRAGLISRITTAYYASAPADSTVSELEVEASVGAIWGLLHHYISTGRRRRLPAMADLLAYIALAPVLGGQEAVEAIQHGEVDSFVAR
jgi:AcrR family transcriptional regulator